MTSNNELLLQLEPFKNNEAVIVHDQSVGDIIDAILTTHKQYVNQYDLIYPYFVGVDPVDTAKNVFNYLKANVKYNIEPEDLQTVKSPAAIIATGKSGSDCKNLALFANGILDAYRRNELQNFDLYYRFASYEYGDKTPQHVFSVMKYNGKEIWIDPVLNFFNQQKSPYFYTDKKIKPMALVALSGINIMDNPYGNYYNKIGDATTQLITAGASTGANLVFPGSGLIVGSLASLITSIFPSGGGTPNDWQGWDALDVQYNRGQLGTSAASHIKGIINNTDSNPKLAAQNILSWISSKGNNGLNLICTTFNTGHDLNGQTVTINDVLNALTKAGYPSQGQSLYNYYQQSIAPTLSTTSLTASTGGISPIILLGGGALLLILLLKK
jgi:hypothetical protein